MKNVKFALLLVVGMIFAFVVPVFAQTSLEEVQAKVERVKNSGITSTSLTDVQKELARIGDERQLAVITGVIHNYKVLYNEEFTSADLREVSLPAGKTVSHIATGLIADGGSNIKNILYANGISPGQEKKLDAGRKLYVLTRMISKDYLLDPYEIALLKRQYEADKAAAKEAVERLTSKANKLEEVIVLKDGIIVDLRKELNVEKAAHAKTKEFLAETREELTVKIAEVQQVKGDYSSLQALAIVISVGVIILFVVYSVIKSRMAEKRQRTADNVAKMQEQHEAGKEGFVAGRTTRDVKRRTVSTMERKSRNSSLDSSMLTA